VSASSRPELLKGYHALVADRPDIVLFMLDQLSAKWLEAARGRVCPTPNFDRLASEGTTFRRCFTSNPVCCPARSTLATGLTCRQHGVLRNGMPLDPRLPTFMHLLGEADYRRGAFGKVHLPSAPRHHPGEAYESVEPNYRPFGFDVTHIAEDHRRGAWLKWVEAEHPRHLRAALATCWPIPVGENDRDLERVLAARAGWSWSTPACPDGEEGFYALPFPEPVSQSAWITDRACDFLKEVPPETPLLAQVSYVQPHTPWAPPAEAMHLVDSDLIPEPIEPTWPEDPDHPTFFDASRSVRREVPGNWRSQRRCYFTDIAHLDQKLGELYAALEATDRLDRTAIVMLADHGEMLWDHGCVEKENKHYDACIRVPLVMRLPAAMRQRRGEEVSAIVQLEDVMPTLLELAGVSNPLPVIRGDEGMTPPRGLPGRSLLGWCGRETPEAWRDAAYVESFSRAEPGEAHHWSGRPDLWVRTVRTAGWRYSYSPAGGGEQLFDLRADPDETHNLVRDRAAATIRSEMRDRLLDALILQDAPQIYR